ncbi:uncharacterized protein PG986_011948 [Apiospora aurea]|uniref:Trichothecene 3-O-acetyltransferase-like N-terminal domain-containing protein n=1 Tax=Apiospora aurea TaxID=335848 RepID=A0ABR1PYK8_9PEZI
MKDLRRDFPPAIAEYWKSGGGGSIPASLLDETVLAPCGTFSHSAEPAAPVLLLQANLVPGGLVLVMNGLHSCMDLAGQAQMARLLAKACRGEPFSAEEVSTGNMPRRDILLPLLHLSDEELLEGPDSTTATGASEETTDDPTEGKDDQNDPSPTITAAPDHLEEHRRPPQAALRWSTFTFSSPALRALKAAATATMPSSPDVGDGERTPFISTDDALSALLWQSIARSRLARLPNTTTTTTTLTRTVDARRYVAGLPHTYPGDAAFKVSSTLSPASLLSQPLGAVAAGLRARLRPHAVRDGIRVHISQLAKGRAADGGSNGGGGGLDPSTGVNLSSWAKESCYDFDFGSDGGDGLGVVGLGRPAVVQRPVFTDDVCESLVYLMPRRPDGEITALMCLRELDMERMREDSEMVRYGQYVG